MEIDDLTDENLAGLVLKVMNNPAYREKALYFQNAIAKTRGLNVAADTIERVFQNH